MPKIFNEFLKNLATFELKDLVHKHVSIELFVDGDLLLYVARDLKDSTIYVLEIKEKPIA